MVGIEVRYDEQRVTDGTRVHMNGEFFVTAESSNPVRSCTGGGGSASTHGASRSEGLEEPGSA